MNERTYCVLIVDDEEKDRSILRILLNRQYGPLFHILEAENAGRAQELLESQKVDLLMVDIHMPGVSGLELLETLDARGIWPYTIILTAYSYFEYAKEAIRYRVNGFILKPPIRQELYEAVQRFLDWDLEEKRGRRIDPSSQSVFSRALGNCIMLNGSRQEIDTYKELLDIQENRVFCVLVSGKNVKGREENLENSIEAAMSAIGFPSVTVPLQNRIAVFCFTNQEMLGQQEFSVASALKENLASWDGMEIAVGDVVSLYDNPNTAYRSAIAQMNRLGNRRDEPVETTLSRFLKNGELEEAAACLEQYLTRYWERHDIDDLMLEDIKILTVVRKNLQVREDQIGAKMLDIFLTGNIQDITRFSSAYLLEIADNQPGAGQGQQHHVVRLICRQLAKQLDKPWSINDFADEYGFNPIYLGRLFKKEMGTSFTNYLMEQRIEKAIEMMADANLTIAVIGEAVGYNQNYFSRIFKRHTGMSPNEYRRSLPGASPK